MNEGNILSFRVFIDSKGFLMTEYTSLPEDKVSKVFKGNDVSIIQKVVTEGLPNLQGLHRVLEEELSALNHTSSI